MRGSSVERDRYAQCLSCGHIMLMRHNNLLKFDMPCPTCGRERQFGPKVYVEDFDGYTLREAADNKTRYMRTNAFYVDRRK